MHFKAFNGAFYLSGAGPRLTLSALKWDESETQLRHEFMREIYLGVRFRTRFFVISRCARILCQGTALFQVPMLARVGKPKPGPFDCSPEHTFRHRHLQLYADDITFRARWLWNGDLSVLKMLGEIWTHYTRPRFSSNRTTGHSKHVLSNNAMFLELLRF